MSLTVTDVPDVGSTPVQDLPTVYKTYTATDFLIGLFICLGARAFSGDLDPRLMRADTAIE